MWKNIIIALLLWYSILITVGLLAWVKMFNKHIARCKGENKPKHRIDL